MALNGKTFLIAGGAGLIGGETSERLAREGASVVVADLDDGAAHKVADGIASNGGTAFGCGLDVADESSVAACFDTARSQFGGLDGVYINAADLSAVTIGQDSNALDVSLDVFDRTIKVNLRGHLLCTRQAIPLLLERGGGAIVYTSSAAAFVGEGERPSYAIAKAGLGALVRHVASRWGRQGVRANAVAPGYIPKETASREVADYALSISRSPRLGLPNDIAGVVALLLSDDGAWINGQIINVDGGVVL